MQPARNDIVETLEARRLFATFENIFPEASFSSIVFSDVAVEKVSGAIFATGRFNGVQDIDPGNGTKNISAKNGSDVFVARFSAAGKLQWAKTYDSGDGDLGGKIAIGENGVAVSGMGQGFGIDADTPFVLRYTLAGKRKLAAKAESNFEGEVRAVGIDNKNNVYLGGFTSSQIELLGETIEAPANFGDAGFLFKIDKEGEVAWTKDFQENATFNGITTDAENNVYVTGTFRGESVDFEPDNANKGLLESIDKDNSETFVAKLGPGGKLVWANHLNPGTGFSGFAVRARDIALDGDGNVGITGQFSGGLTDGEDIEVEALGTDIFAAKLDPAGEFVFAVAFGGDASSFFSPGPIGNSVAFDSAGKMLVAGQYQNIIDFNPAEDEELLKDAGDGAKGFLVKLGRNGAFVKFFGQKGAAKSQDFVGVGCGNDDFPVLVGHYLTDEEAFMLKLNKKLRK